MEVGMNGEQASWEAAMLVLIVEPVCGRGIYSKMWVLETGDINK
jgi:hypothetical protein